jgi:hypothetical protein
MWKTSYKKLQADRQRFYAYANIMTQYEAQTIKQSLQEQTEYLAPSIKIGALSEFNQAIAGYEATVAKVDAAKAAELRRWDSAKLIAERQNIQQQIDLAFQSGGDPLSGKNPADQIAKVLAEAKQSGDINRIRAAAEVGRGIVKNAPAVAPQISDLENSLATSRQTPEMAAAEQERIAALNDLFAKKNELPEIGAAIGEPVNPVFPTGSIDRAMRKVRFSQDRSTVEILADDDPEVCGVDMSNLMAG